MKFDAVIFLISEVDTQDDLGNAKSEKTRRKVYANRFSVSRAEFSATGQQGLKPDFSFQINTVDYKDESEAEYLGQLFDVYRVQINGDKTTLYLTRRVANGRS